MDTIRVMADFQCFPLWTVEDGGTEDTDPTTLGLSDDLAGDLTAWAARYDAIFNEDYPPDSSFETPAAEEKFYADGRALARRVAAELVGKYEVTYFNGGAYEPV